MTIPHLDKDPTGQTFLDQTALKALGFYPGLVDNWRGPKTEAALSEYRKSLTIPAELPPETGSELVFNKWPKESAAASFFGYPPTLTQIACPYPMRMEDGGKWVKITKITCSEKVADSLTRIFKAILSVYGTLTAIQAVGLDVYDGCYNDRSVRGSSKRSMHAYGAAIDIDAEHNGLGATKWRMPADAVAIFEAEGWRWGGRYSGRKDAMHFEACS